MKKDAVESHEDNMPTASLLSLKKPSYNNNLTWPIVGGCKTFFPSPRDLNEDHNEGSETTIFLQISKEECKRLRVNPFEDLELIRAAIFESSPGIFYERSARRIVVLDECGGLLYDFQPNERKLQIKKEEEDRTDVDDSSVAKENLPNPHEYFPSPEKINEKEDNYHQKFHDPEEEIEDRILNRREMTHLFQWYYPEGGWGYVILIVSILNQILCQGLHFSIGFPLAIYIKEKFEQVHSFHIGCLISLSFILSNVVSILTIAFCRKKSARIMAVIGGLTLALGTLFTSFVTQFHQLFISYGVIIAISVSMIRDSSTLMIGQYFKKNREVIEIFFVGSTGFGLTVMSSLTYTFISHYKWRLGLQIITIIVSSSFILGTFFRSASLYHPQRRAILHLKSRKVFNDKCKMMFKSYPYFDFSAFKNSTNVQILVLSAAMSSAGFVSPILLLTFDGTTDGFSTQDILIFNINLGLGWSMGCGLFGFLIFNMSEECKIPRQYLSQSCLIVGGISVILFAMVVENSSGYYIFVWVYGISLGGFQYCIKMTIFQKVRSRNFSQTWSILQLIQGLSMGVIFIFTCYLNWKFTNKCGYYFCGSCLILGCIGLYLITLRNTFIKQTSIDKLRHKNDKLKRTLRFNSEGLNHSKRPPYSDHLYQKANSDENQLEIQKYEKIDEVDGNNEADEDVNYLPKSFIEDIANLNEITSCSKVEKNILQSEIENCILQRQDDPQELNTTKSNGRGNTNFYLSIVDYKLFLQRYSGQSQLKA